MYPGLLHPVHNLRTMHDVERKFLGYSPSMGESYDPSSRTKANYASSTGALVNPLYSELAYRQILLDETLQGALSKGPWVSGRRYFKTAFSTTGADGAVAEGGAIKTALTNTEYEQVYTPKVTTHTVDITDTYRLLSSIDNNLSPEQLIDQNFAVWKDLRERQMHLDYNDITLTTSIDSLMRALATSTTTTNLSYTANDEDYPIGGIDKGTETWAEPYANVPATAQNFSLDLIDTAVQNCEPYWRTMPGGRGGAFIYTGYSGYKKIKQHVGPEVWQEATNVSFGVGGIQTEPGSDFKRAVSAYDKMPIIQGNRMWATGTTSDIALIHRDAIETSVLMMPLVIQSADVILNEAFVGRTVFEAQEELQVKVFKALGWVGKLA